MATDPVHLMAAENGDGGLRSADAGVGVLIPIIGSISRIEVATGSVVKGVPFETVATAEKAAGLNA